MLDTNELSGLLKGFDCDAASYRRALESLGRVVRFTQPLLISTFPRGRTQIFQPGHCPETLLRAYSREGFSCDRATWQAILRGKAFNERQLWPDKELESSPYFRAVMEPHGWAYLAVAPLRSPLLQGYAGAIHLYRKADRGPFSAAELQTLGGAAQVLDQAIEKFREPRRRAACGKLNALEDRRPFHQFIFDAAGNPLPLHRAGPWVDESLSSAMRQEAQRRLASLHARKISDNRIELADSHGELWPFKVALFEEFPALGEGPFVFFCLQPDSCEWCTLRPGDFQADPDLARLIPTFRFMQQVFNRMPALASIAAKAHLSPFHFHRRFTEMVGQTPKQFMLGCQIHLAESMLIEHKRPLSDIAAACGFAHQSHFTSRFKQATGLTPTRWRRLGNDTEGIMGRGDRGHGKEIISHR